MEIIRDFFAASYTTVGSVLTITLSPLVGSETHPVDLPVGGINVLTTAAAGSCARFWQTSGTCARFQVCITKIS